MIRSGLRRLASGTSLLQRGQQWKALRALQRWTPVDQSRIDFYKRLLGPKDLAFDVGANMANRTRLFRILCERVIAIEPQQMCLQVLRRAFANDPKVVIVDAALGAAPGEAQLRTGTSHVLATLSAEWLESARQSGRFSGEAWTTTQTVTVLTLDQLIEKYGMPAYIKIDVEGFEIEVLKGLTRSVRAISFEFVPERLDTVHACLDELERVGMNRFNLVIGEETEFRATEWLSRATLLDHIGRLRGDSGIFGDIYARRA